jgi:16S rRNA G966 N2-methylase RsmD
MAHDVIMAADVSRVFAPQTIMAIESARREKVEKSYSNLVMYDQREFGDKFLSFFTPKA